MSQFEAAAEEGSLFERTKGLWFDLLLVPLLGRPHPTASVNTAATAVNIAAAAVNGAAAAVNNQRADAGLTKQVHRALLSMVRGL